MDSVTPSPRFNNNVFDPVAKEKLVAKAGSWLLVIVSSIMSVGILPVAILARTIWRKYHNVDEKNKTIKAISNLFKKNIPTQDQKQTLPPPPAPLPPVPIQIQTQVPPPPTQIQTQTQVPPLPIQIQTQTKPPSDSSLNFIEQNPIQRTLAWKFFPENPPLSSEEVKKFANLIKEKVETVRKETIETEKNQEYIIEAKDFFDENDENRSGKIELVLDYLLLTDVIGMYVKTRGEAGYRVTVDPSKHTDDNPGEESSPLTTKEILKERDSLLNEKIKKFEECIEKLPQNLNPENLVSIFKEILHFNYSDITVNLQKKEIPKYEFKQREFDIAPYLDFLVEKKVCVAWKNADQKQQVVTDSRFTDLGSPWRTKATIDEEQAFQEANRIDIDFPVFPDVLDSEKELFKACIAELNERTSAKTFEFNFGECSSDSINTFIKFMNEKQTKVVCKRSTSPSTTTTVYFKTKNPSAV